MEFDLDEFFVGTRLLDEDDPLPSSYNGGPEQVGPHNQPIIGTGDPSSTARDVEALRRWQFVGSPLHVALLEKAELQEQAEKYRAGVAYLKWRLDMIEGKLYDDARRTIYLERENRRLRCEVKALAERSGSADNEDSTLESEDDDTSASYTATDEVVFMHVSNIILPNIVANQEEQKVKSAVHHKHRRSGLERKMKKERDDALAAVEELKKINTDLQSQLTIEQSGIPHLREGGPGEGMATVSIPVEFNIDRADFRKLQFVFEWNQIKVQAGFEEFYRQWKKPASLQDKTDGTDHVENKKRRIRIGVNIDDGFTTFGEQKYSPVFAEHDGCPLKRDTGDASSEAREVHDTEDGGCSVYEEQLIKSTFP
ncbi:hypothetical protein BU24DRAFT_426402 [Aaosphaeria arxii CBS 175.79]|uniref:Uncharacterized protein n=1 Tax=Aaosphaeria arxii CBS 175.79 TaxID=1450172 RepID=A0A6A5XDU5_9PLEO|nr:uncharacterized protein BU24DRAFT_426402 [Aaosphaeria arxii CBS 175.79]KAF2011315.1 hypothetical protein BU24DRAFT_426402 [Aaosphaeria arxii CBS 175.79]